MTETATHHPTSNPLLQPQTYWRVSAVALSGVALLGVVLNLLGQGELLAPFLAFDWTHNVLHIVLAGTAFLFGFGPVSHGLARSAAAVFGFVYLGLGVFGFFIADLAVMHLEIGENLVHILLGAWALVTAFSR